MEGNYSGDYLNIGEVRVCTDEERVGEEEQEDLKRRIAGHPLYGVLVENHTNCLKVGLGEMGETGEIGVPSTATDNANFNLKAPTIPSYSELDQFMEEYCNALNKLKEAMDDPIKETASFITAMYAQLEELSGGSKKPH